MDGLTGITSRTFSSFAGSEAGANDPDCFERADVKFAALCKLIKEGEFDTKRALLEHLEQIGFPAQYVEMATKCYEQWKLDTKHCTEVGMPGYVTLSTDGKSKEVDCDAAFTDEAMKRVALTAKRTPIPSDQLELRVAAEGKDPDVAKACYSKWKEEAHYKVDKDGKITTTSFGVANTETRLAPPIPLPRQKTTKKVPNSTNPPKPPSEQDKMMERAMKKRAEALRRSSTSSSNDDSEWSESPPPQPPKIVIKQPKGVDGINGIMAAMVTDEVVMIVEYKAKTKRCVDLIFGDCSIKFEPQKPGISPDQVKAIMLFSLDDNLSPADIFKKLGYTILVKGAYKPVTCFTELRLLGEKKEFNFETFCKIGTTKPGTSLPAKKCFMPTLRKFAEGQQSKPPIYDYFVDPVKGKLWCKAFRKAIWENLRKRERKHSCGPKDPKAWKAGKSTVKFGGDALLANSVFGVGTQRWHDYKVQTIAMIKVLDTVESPDALDDKQRETVLAFAREHFRLDRRNDDAYHTDTTDIMAGLVLAGHKI